MPAEFVEAARRVLSEQREFRISQLIQLDASRPEAVAEAVRKEVHAKLTAGAITVLSDIDSALRRIEQGTYGCCQRCGEPMSLRRLIALPMAFLCGSCQCMENLDGSESHDRAGTSIVGEKLRRIVGPVRERGPAFDDTNQT